MSGFMVGDAGTVRGGPMLSGMLVLCGVGLLCALALDLLPGFAGSAGVCGAALPGVCGVCGV